MAVKTTVSARCTLNWDCSREDFDLIHKIADRAGAIYASQNPRASVVDKARYLRSTMMDVNACHANGCPLMLKELLEAKGFDFTHDIQGITDHIDRRTGKLDGSVLPRYAKPEKRKPS